MAKHKYIETPEKMWELFTAYKKEVKDNPTIVQDFVGRDAMEVERQKERPLIMEGFECYILDHTKINYPDLTRYFEGKPENSFSAFVPVCSRIRLEIRRDHINGGMTEIYNASITQRLNNLKETTVLEAAEQPLFPKVKKIEENPPDELPIPFDYTNEG